MDDDMMDGLVKGVGLVCIGAGMLERSLVYLAHIVEGWDDAKIASVLGKPGGPLAAFRKIAPSLEQLLGPDVATLLGDIERCLGDRNRVVHSVMMLDGSLAGTPVYEAWHARTDQTNPVSPEELVDLAQELALCTVQAGAVAEGVLDLGQRFSSG